MHGLSLRVIRARVERLAAGMACDGEHQLLHVSLVPHGAPVPPWPPADAATGCICGAALEYVHVIHKQDEPVAE
jgi:hypothetical protein